MTEPSSKLTDKPWYAGGIFHGNSVAGVWRAAAAGMLVGTEWRYAYLIGVVPALLVLWVRAGIKEPERWSRLVRRNGGTRLSRKRR